MKRLSNLIDIRLHNPEVYNKLMEKDCVIYVNHECIYEGKYDKKIGFDLENPEQAIIIFNLDEGYAMFTIAENKSLNKVIDIFENKKYDEVMKDPKLYNKIKNLEIDLPQFPLIIEGSNVERIYSFLSEAEDDSLLGEEDENEDESSEDGDDKKEEEKEEDKPEGEDEDSVPGDGLPSEKEKEDKKKLKRRGEIQFTIWEEPDKKVEWLDKNGKYQKIEYVYQNKKKGLSIDFLLGKQDGTWKLWTGKPGSTSYDDDPYSDTKEKTFEKGIIKALDKVEEMIDDVENNPDEWPQFYINI